MVYSVIDNEIILGLVVDATTLITSCIKLISLCLEIENENSIPGSNVLMRNKDSSRNE